MNHSVRILRTTLTGTLLCICLTAAACAATYGVGTVTGDSLRLREGAGSNTAILTTVSKGETVVVLENQANGWYKVDLNGTVGYMSADYLSVSVQANTDLGPGTLNTDGASLNMRSGPGTNYSKLASIPGNAVLTISGLENGWYKTSFNGVSGYVSSDYITLNNSAPSSAPAPAETPSTKIGIPNTGGSSLNMRSGPGTDYRKLASIPSNASLSIIGEENGWFKISYNGSSGYVSSDYVTLTGATQSANTSVSANNAPTPPSVSTSSPRAGILNTNGSSLNMRSGPGTGYGKLASIPANVVLSITGEESGWYKTSYLGVIGYVSADYVIISDAAVATPAPANGDVAAQLVAYAKQFMGLPYVYGANGPNSFDCSSYTSHVYKHFGYSLNRSAAGQYSNGTPIDLSQIQVGDLILWRAYGSSKTATHVGIYIGNNQYIHASSTAKRITINDMNYGTNARYIVGVRRILT